MASFLFRSRLLDNEPINDDWSVSVVFIIPVVRLAEGNSATSANTLEL